MKIQNHRIDTNVVVGLLVREFRCSGSDVSAKVLAMYAGTRTPPMEPQWLAAGLSQPVWWHATPAPINSFLESYDLTGKTIIPFITHGGSGFSRTIQTISDLQPNATVLSDGLSISRNNVAGAENDVVAWIKGLNLSTQ